MDEREPLLSARVADPDAIENWLVYADWLTEHDDPRGELTLARNPEPLRHVELYGQGFPETNEERDELRARIAALFPKAVVTGIGSDGEPYVPGSRPSSVEPAALQGIGDAVMRLVDKMKARMPKP